MRKRKRFLITLLAALLTLCGSVSPAAALRMEPNPFPDIQPGDWFYDNVQLLYQFEIIDGYTDGLFHPGDFVTRGQFIKMLGTYEGLYTTTPAPGHWAEKYWHIMDESGVLETQTIQNGQVVVNPLFDLSPASLDKPITRYEMSMLINNMLYNVFCENKMKLNDAAALITDYATLDAGYRNPVEQAYGKGILTGCTDGSFLGNNTLSRAEAATVIARLFWGSKRIKVESAEEVIPVVTPTDSFAFQYRTMSVEARRVALFGSANKTCFTSAADAGDNIVEVVVPVWKLNGSGQKYSSTAYIQVHRLVADEVQHIFEDIFNDPERFPIKSVGGARYSDALRHSWGCAIDINPNENYYQDYRSGQKTGSCWLPGENPYSISPDGSVVRAFAKYGWGWGGQGWSSGVDYMHFSILASGG